MSAYKEYCPLYTNVKYPRPKPCIVPTTVPVQETPVSGTKVFFRYTFPVTPGLLPCGPGWKKYTLTGRY